MEEPVPRGPRLVTTRQDEAIGAVHRIVRAESSFEESPGSLPYADPVETLLDLHELHLTAQAEALVRRMRGGATEGGPPTMFDGPAPPSSR